MAEAVKTGLEQVTLPPVNVNEFGVLMLALRKLPYEVSSELIQKIQLHVKMQVGE
jgi:hypothetical protein